MEIALKVIEFILIGLVGYILAVYILRELADKNFDNELNIYTKGTRSWKGSKRKVYHRTESTPYIALITLMRNHKFAREDQLVDFGSGKGRVTIFMQNYLGIKTTGVELDETAYIESVNNRLTNLRKYQLVSGDIFFKNEYAEKYEIDEKDNKFFFFNPFNVSIFEKVVENITANARIHNKEVEIILYYPTAKYRKLMKANENFEISKVIFVKGAITPTERFEIYKFTPDS